MRCGKKKEERNTGKGTDGTRWKARRDDGNHDSYFTWTTAGQNREEGN